MQGQGEEAISKHGRDRAYFRQDELAERWQDACDLFFAVKPGFAALAF